MERAFIGMVFLWYGLLSDIPAGWQLCDGSNGTPNLRNRFIIGARASGFPEPHTTAGEVEHYHPFATGYHPHAIIFGSGLYGVAGIKMITTSNIITGNTELKNNLPPYKALCYIKKVE